MNNLKDLEALGLTMPSPLYLVGAVLFGIFGYVAYRRGRKTSSVNLTCSGIVLMVYPYAISQTWQLWMIGTALCGWIYYHWQ